MAELAKGFTCQCGEYHRYPVYVYSHWDELLDFTCPKCNAKYQIVRGHAVKQESKRRRKKAS